MSNEMDKDVSAKHQPGTSAEIQEKLALMRHWLSAYDAGAIRLRGSDWFAWATAGGCSTVLQSAETGVAEVLVSAREAIILSDEIEARRLQEEEVPDDQYQWSVNPWAAPSSRDRFVEELADGMPVLSDRPEKAERPLPAQCHAQRMRLSDTEQARYARVGARAAAAMAEVMYTARPDWSELELAGAGARALWARGLHPSLVLAAGADRMGRYRHPTPTPAALGGAAMLVFCARGYGLVVSLTRFVYFAPLDVRQQRLHGAVRTVEAAGLQSCAEGQSLSGVYRALDRAYRTADFPHAIREHHQGGIAGYLAREAIAMPDSSLPLERGMAIALNPSLPGAKIEDTFLLGQHGLDNLTLAPGWPTIMQNGLARPLPLETT